MHSSSPAAAPPGGVSAWFSRIVDWLDARGKPAWIAAMVLGFVFAWPIGLGLLAYMIWSKRMFNRSCGMGRHSHHDRWANRHGAFKSSGNSAFDSYKTDMLRRLEEEQAAFEGFLQRLREAKDKSEFDAFMEDRAKASRPAPTAAGGEGTGAY